jgi:hypothetical protein
MPDEDSSQPASPIEDASQPALPVEDTSQPASLPISPVEAPVAETPDTPSPESVLVTPIPDNSSASASTTEDAPPANSLAPITEPDPIPVASTPDHSSSAYIKSLIPLSKAERERRRQAHIEILVNHAAVKGHVTRRDTQLLLEVSGATADRYIKELISQGRLVKENNGRYTKYRFIR